MTPTRALLSALLALAASALPATARAQTVTPVMRAQATISLPPITGSGIQDLRFGSVLPGDAPDVPPGPAAAGAPTSAAGWLFTGIRKNRDVQATFTLPPALIHGAYSIPIDWDNAGYGTLCLARAGSSTCVFNAAFNPVAADGAMISIPNNTPGNNFDATVYVGARLGNPTVPNVPPGIYAARVTLSYAYVN